MSALGDLLLEHSVRENLRDVNYPAMKKKLRHKLAEVVNEDKKDTNRTYAGYAEILEISERAFHDILSTRPVKAADGSNLMKIMAIIQRYPAGITAVQLDEEFRSGSKQGVPLDPLLKELGKRKWIASTKNGYRPIAEAHLISPPRDATEKAADAVKTLVKILRLAMRQGWKRWDGGGTADVRMFTLRCTPGLESEAFNRIRTAVLEEVRRIENEADANTTPPVDLELILGGSLLLDEER